jgi:formylglycine-generating enzyme required for sulfatase activity
MGQGGNVFEWNESAFDGTNSSSSERRALRGGSWGDVTFGLVSLNRDSLDPERQFDFVGFRVASVPEPSTYVLIALAGAVLVARVVVRRRRS